MSVRVFFSLLAGRRGEELHLNEVVSSRATALPRTTV